MNTNNSHSNNHSNIDTRVKIKNSYLPFPVLVASGTFGYGEEYQDSCDYNNLGAIICKTITKYAREGNPPPRILETEYGSINSIGLANEGMEHFIRHILPLISQYPCPYIVNIAAQSKEEFLEIIAYISEHDIEKNIWGWELNLSCPNVSAGTNFGKNPHHIEQIVSHIRPHTDLPLIVKLPPNVDDITTLGIAAEHSGADAISACNTFLGMGIDIYKKSPILSRVTGGYSGTAIFPASLALVYQLCKAVKIPVLGIGGITHGAHAIQYLLAGASAVQIGTANFKTPNTSNLCNDAIVEYCKSQKLCSMSNITL